jgi:hypothetical protein
MNAYQGTKTRYKRFKGWYLEKKLKQFNVHIHSTLFIFISVQLNVNFEGNSLNAPSDREVETI